MEDDGVAELEFSALSSCKAIARVAVPAIVLNAAPPLTIAVQTALVGRFAPTAALAAFAAVSTCVAFVARAANFLVDSVSSKVGGAVGRRDWAELAGDCRQSVRWSAALGAAAVPLLLALRTPLLAGLVGVSEEVQAVANEYWVVRCFALPFQLLCMSGAGILQGFGHVNMNAGLASAAALLEMLGSAAVLAGPFSNGSGSSRSNGSLLALGCISLACQALQAAASLACVAAMPPPEAKGCVHPLRGVFSLSSSSSSRGGGGSGGCGSNGVASSSARRDSRTSERQQPLLGDESEPGQGPADASEAAAQPGSPSGLRSRWHQAAQQHDGGDASMARSSGSGWFDAATRKFLRDGLNMFIRTLTLQLSFFLALAAAARLGTVALAAHAVVNQCWVLISYAVDGFAVAAIVLGSRLAGSGSGAPQHRAAAQRHMRRLTGRVLLAGGASGLAAGLAFYLGRARMPGWFSSDPAVAEALRAGGVWGVLAAAQPLNSLVFVLDGLMYATGAFRFVRDMMVLGFLLVFCPALAAEAWLAPGLAAIWLAKAALNVWRLAGALWLVYARFLPRFGEAGGGGGQGGSGGGGGAQDEEA